MDYEKKTALLAMLLYICLIIWATLLVWIWGGDIKDCFFASGCAIACWVFVRIEIPK